MKIYVYYTPGCVELLREVDRVCQESGCHLRLLTPRSTLGSRLARRYPKAPQWMIAMHAVGGGEFVDLEKGGMSRKYSKRQIETLLKDNASLYSRTATS
jgi:hypothetical protein